MYTGNISKKNLIITGSLVAAILVTIDQISKYLIVVYQNSLLSNPIEVFSDFFQHCVCKKYRGSLGNVSRE